MEEVIGLHFLHTTKTAGKPRAVSQRTKLSLEGKEVPDAQEIQMSGSNYEVFLSMEELRHAELHSPDCSGRRTLQGAVKKKAPK